MGVIRAITRLFGLLCVAVAGVVGLFALFGFTVSDDTAGRVIAGVLAGVALLLALIGVRSLRQREQHRLTPSPAPELRGGSSVALRKCRECGNQVSSRAKTCPQCGAPVKAKTSPLAGALAFLVIVAICAGVCTRVFDGDDKARHPSLSQPDGDRSRGAATVSESARPAVPRDVSYSIIDSSALPPVKRSVDVRLNKKVSEVTLKAIALKLKAQDPQQYERTFIAYYLPGMVVGAGAWATTHFNPDLEVRILGLTAEEEDKLLSEPPSQTREVIGRWLDESPHIGSSRMVAT
jgi:hypothetical protein